MKACISALLCFVFALTATRSQDVEPIAISDPGILDPIAPALLTQIDGSPMPVYIGWNWGPGLRNVSSQLHSNIWHVHNFFGPNADDAGGSTEMSRAYQEVSKTVPGMRLILEPNRRLAPNATVVQFQNDSLPWYASLYNREIALIRPGILLNFGGDDPVSLTEGMGIRYQPEIDVPTVSPETSFTPRVGDQQGAVFGFQTRAIGTGDPGSVPAPGNPNAERIVLTQTGPITPAVNVLSGCWPNTALAEWGESSGTRQTAPFNGRRMYLAINLRRTDISDNADNGDVILRIRVEYNRCGAPPFTPTTGDVIFDSLPSTARFALPLTLDDAPRGTVSRLVSCSTGVAVTEIVITRDMLPHGNATDPDITLLAHCIFDEIPYENTDPDPTITDVTNFNEMFLQDVWNVHGGCSGGSERVRSLNIVVDYEGRSDVAIDWVQLATDNMTRFTQGYYDYHGHRTFRDDLQDIADFNTANARHSSLASDSAAALRVYRWYNRDEGDMQYWEGMRYFDRLFGRLSITERGFGSDYDRYNHIVSDNDHFSWQGATPAFNAATVEPYYKEGWHAGGAPVADNVMAMQFNNEWGMNSIYNPAASSDVIDYDLACGYSTTSGTTLPADLTLPFYPGIVGGVVQFGSGSVQQKYESHRYTIMQNPDYLFNPNQHWVCNSWLHSTWQAVTPTDIVAPQPTWRVLTAEEARLSIWSQIILGSKGLIMYWGANIDSVENPADYTGDNPGGFARELGFTANLVQPVPGRHVVTAEAMSTIENAFNFDNVGAGADFIRDMREPDNSLSYGYRTGLYDAVDGGPGGGRLATVETNLDVDPDRLYVGALSMRKSVKEITDVLWNARDTIANLTLLRWYSHGFREWDIPAVVYPATNELDAIFGSDRTKFRTRHLWRDVASPATQPYLNTRTYEDFDSAFFEVSLLKDGTNTLQQSFVVGVLNRRCNPFDMTATPTTDFISYAEWETALTGVTAGQRGNARFRQKGSREIELPFNFQHTDGKYRNLRVREIGSENNATIGRLGLDTIIGQDQVLHVNFLPGEGKLLHVTVLNPVATADAPGYLDHSNQRKLVYYPKVLHIAPKTDPVVGNTYWPTVYDDNHGYYHMVYYRRDTEPNGRLSVYYRRSTPIVGDRVHDASHLSTITWEPEILLSANVWHDQNGDGDPDEGEVDQPDCAYPSVVARYDFASVPPVSKVYIVYACETEGGAWTPEPIPGCPMCTNIWIVESILPAEHPNQAAFYAAAPPPRRIAVATQPVAHSLEHWGTPTINASYGGNWYAWSSYTDGINVNYKEPNWQTFNQGPIVRANLPVLYNGALKGTHPSLNTYSRQHVGEVDAALVWQEGTYGPVGQDLGQYINYTRLRLTPAGQPNNYLFPNVVPAPILSGNLVYNPGLTIAQLAAPGPGPGFRHYYPVIFRNLSDYATTTASPYHNLRLVNHKAERVMWQRDPNAGPGAVTKIARKSFDFWDNTLRWPATPNLSTAMATYLIVNNEASLLGPDIAQGWNYSEHVGGAAPVGPWYEDSVNVLNFWSAPHGLVPATIWHMQYGWNFYGQTHDDFLYSLVASGMAEELTTPGIYPHLAARGTMSFDPAFGKNRRVYNDINGVWPNWLAAPNIIQSSEQFFKENTAKHDAEILLGYRGEESDLSVSAITIDDNERHAFSPVYDDEREVIRFQTDWFSIADYAKQSIAILSNTEQAGATVSIEREVDGEKLEIYTGYALGQATVLRSELRLIDGGTERYRYIIEPHDDVAPVEDIALSEIDYSQEKVLEIPRVINLRTMAEEKIQSGLHVQPNLASERIILSLDENATGASRNKSTLVIVDALGREYHRSEMLDLQFLQVDVSTWPSGLYTVQTSPVGSTMPTTIQSKSFLVVH